MSNPTVLIAAGCSAATVTRYRCLHLQEQLAHLGIPASVQEWYSDEAIPRTLREQPTVLILQRVPMSTPLAQLLATLRSQGTTVLFDTDDLIFEPELTHWHRGVARLPPVEQELYHTGVRRYLATLQASDGVLTASPLLAQLAERRGKRAFVHRNAVGQAMQTLGDQLYHQRMTPKDARQPSSFILHPSALRAHPSSLIIGYGSGTPTHDVDFEQMAPALLEIMTRHPQVQFWAIGPLILPPAFAVLGQRVQRFPLTDWPGFFELQAQFDINLAPLEQGNLFCRAKSEIKVVEAGLLGVPTVASRLDPFEFAIRHGENGLLAGNLLEWIDALERLITQPERRIALGQAARHMVEARYSLSVRAAELATAWPALIAPPSLLSTQSSAARAEQILTPLSIRWRGAGGEAATPLTLNWLVTEPVPGSGGHLGIFRMVKHLVEFGHECHLYIIPVHNMLNWDASQLREWIERTFFPTGAHYHCWTGQVLPADATFATYWKTVPTALKLLDAGQLYYLVQDFEPFFYAVGSEYLQCENTYRAGLHCLTLGRWLGRLMRERYHAAADHFDFAVETEIYQPRSALQPVGQDDPPRIAFYARPNTPRRGYELGIAALQLVKARRPEVEIILYGANELAPPPAFVHTNLGIRAPHELAALYASCTVGLALSLTNPSFVPLEMMACRCAVVDIQNERVEGLLIDGENAVLAEPTPAGMAEAILQLLSDAPRRTALVERAWQTVRRMSWQASARQLEAVLLRQAPLPTERVAVRRGLNETTGTLLWQIDHLLAAGEQKRVEPIALTRTLATVLTEKAQLAARLQQREQRLAQLEARLPQRAERLVNEIWRLGERTTRLLEQRGATGLAQEIFSYLRWRWLQLSGQL